MNYIDDEKQLQDEVIQKDKSKAAQITEETAKSSESQPTARPRSAKKKFRKKVSKRGKGLYTIVDKEPIVEMVSDSKDKKEIVKRKVQICAEAKMLKETSPCKDGRTSVVEQLKLTKLSSSPGLNRTSPTLLGTNLLGTSSESKVGLSKRRPLTRDKSDASVGNLNIIRMNISKAQYVCGSGLPEDQSYLNITSQKFYDHGITRT